MALTPEEKLQVETAVDTFLESPTVQSAVTGVLATIEASGVAFLDAVIANAKPTGLLAGIINALKGSAEAELNALVAALPPATLTALATKSVEGELKTILGG